MVELLKELMGKGRWVDAFALARFFYRIGEPIVSDAFYDNFQNTLEKEGMGSEYLTRTYDDDPIPVDLLREFNLESSIPHFSENYNKYYDELDEEKSLSIKAITEYYEAFEFRRALGDKKSVFSLKVDGVNSKTKIVKDRSEDEYAELKLSLSRGRASKSFDFTEGLLRCLPRYYKTSLSDFKLFTETYVETDYLPFMQARWAENNTSKKYKTEKSTALSMLRVPHADEDYEHMRVLAFFAEGLSDTISGTFAEMEKMGLETVPYFIVDGKEIPHTFNEFRDWLDTQFDTMYEMGLGIPSDGVVWEVDSLHADSQISGQYSTRNIALKMSYWSHKVFVAVVKNVITQQKLAFRNCRIELEPVKASDGTEAKFINAYNMGIVMQEGVDIGNTVLVERNSGAINSIIRKGKRIQTMNSF